MELKNNFYFKKILKYCSINIRSRTEVLKKLRSFQNISEDEKNEIILFLSKNMFMFEDEDYLNRYLSNLSSVKGYSRSTLFSKLISKISDKKLLSSRLERYFSENEEYEIDKFVLKNKNKLLKKDFQKQITYLTQRGFSFEKSIKALKNNL